MTARRTPKADPSAATSGEPTESVTLAYPFEHDGQKYDPDTSLELPRGLARQLVRDGKARTSDQTVTPSNTEE